MTEFNQIVLGIIAITIFAFLLISFAVEGGSPYGKGTADLSEQTNITGLKQTIESIQGESEEWEESVYESQDKGILESVIGFLVKSFFNIFLGIIRVIMAPFKGMIFMFNDILGIPIQVSSTLVAIIIISMIFAIYKVVRQGG